MENMMHPRILAISFNQTNNNNIEQCVKRDGIIESNAIASRQTKVDVCIPLKQSVFGLGDFWA